MWVRMCWNWLQMMCIMFFWLTFCFDCDQGYDQKHTLQFQEHGTICCRSKLLYNIGLDLSKSNVWGGRSFGLGCQTFSPCLCPTLSCVSQSQERISIWIKLKSTNIKGRFFTWGSHRPALKWYCFNMDCIERPTWHRSSKPHWWSPLASPVPQHKRGQNQMAQWNISFPIRPDLDNSSYVKKN